MVCHRRFPKIITNQQILQEFWAEEWRNVFLVQFYFNFPFFSFTNFKHLLHFHKDGIIWSAPLQENLGKFHLKNIHFIILNGIFEVLLASFEDEKIVIW